MKAAIDAKREGFAKFITPLQHGHSWILLKSCSTSAKNSVHHNIDRASVAAGLTRDH